METLNLLYNFGKRHRVCICGQRNSYHCSTGYLLLMYTDFCFLPPSTPTPHTAKLVPLAYGIHTLQISCVVEDDKVGTDFLEESITAYEDLVSRMVG